MPSFRDSPTPARGLPAWARALRAALAHFAARAFAPAFGADAEARRAQHAAELLTAALAEPGSAARLERLGEALAAGQALAGGAGDIVVMEASLHLGEKLRAAGRRSEAAIHLARAVERSFRVPDPVGRQRRAGALTRIGILAQESGDPARAKLSYEEALRLGTDTDSELLLGMLTQAAFNLGILESDGGDEDAACRTWRRAIDLGARCGDASGWDPAAVAAFNLGYLHARRGETELARGALEEAGHIAQPSATPLARMAQAKSELALATLAEAEGLGGELEAAGHYARGLEAGRACPLPEGRVAAVQCAIGLGERSVQAGRHGDGAVRFKEAIELAAGVPSEMADRYVVVAHMRLGQSLAEAGERESAVAPLREAFERGRASTEPWVRELGAQAACSLHRVLGALERWDEARPLAREAEAFASSLESPSGRALAAAAAYARAFGELHDGRASAARESLREVARMGMECGADVGVRVGLDALMLAGHLDRQEGRGTEALAQFRRALEALEGRKDPESDALAAIAGVNAGHCLLSLDRPGEARRSYERALARGRASGLPTGRAAAANAGLNLASLSEDELGEAGHRELLAVVIALGRSSRTPLGEQCARTAERALGGGDGPPDDARG